MHSLAIAARLLDDCDSARATTPLLEALGFDSGLIPLSKENLAKLGIVHSEEIFFIARTAGVLRAIVIETDAAEVRTTVNRVASTLAVSAPELLWITVATNRTSEVAIAAVDPSMSRARVTALIARRGHIVDSDSETLSALASARGSSELLTHCRWIEILGRESISRRFYRALERAIGDLASSLEPTLPDADASEMALLYASRLLFLSFLETKGWLDGDHAFLANQFAECMLKGGGYHRKVLAPLFFGTLNTPPSRRAVRARAFGRIPFLNGGLFSKSPLETRTARSAFSDEALGNLFGDVLTRYRFTAREDTTRWSEAAVDPEMLGKAFESLMSSRDRKRSGAFYTPQALVVQVTSSALSRALASSQITSQTVAEALAGTLPTESVRGGLLDATEHISVLDPACGSGAFLVHALEELALLRERLGDERPLHSIRRSILTRSIFGVDINPMAVWLCELRLWLSMAIEDPENDPLRVVPLPNLDRNVRTGNSLSGNDFTHARFTADGRRIARLRIRYVRSSGIRKRSLGRALDRAEREQAIAASERATLAIRSERKEVLAQARSRDLFGSRANGSAHLKTTLVDIRRRLGDSVNEVRRLRGGAALPFSFVSSFSEIATRGGFDVVIGNPPWVRTHNFDRASRDLLRRSFDVYRNSAWQSGTDASSASRGFASQVDAAALFTERSLKLLRNGGVAALILPAKLWRSLAGGGVRDLLSSRSHVREIHDLTSSSSLFEAAVYPSVVVTQRCQSGKSGKTDVLVHRLGQSQRWACDFADIPFDDSRGSPWILVPHSVRRSFDALRSAGVPLSRSSIGRPLLGAKTGCNDAFLATSSNEEDEEAFPAMVNSRYRGRVEREMIRPALRGEHIQHWTVPANSLRILWTHDSRGVALRSLPAASLKWLKLWRRELELRTDAKGTERWWSCFRVEGADCTMPRVVWSDMGRAPKAAVLPAGDTSVPLNSCYVAKCCTIEDALTLTAIINSDVVAAWLSVIAEPARGGYRRYMGWTMGILPLPRDWLHARSILTPIARAARESSPPSTEQLRAAVLDAYQLSDSDVGALLEWASE